VRGAWGEPGEHEARRLVTVHLSEQCMPQQWHAAHDGQIPRSYGQLPIPAAASALLYKRTKTANVLLPHLSKPPFEPAHTAIVHNIQPNCALKS
jgi:hypothetical protein